jgi:hypothetical protein
MKDHPYGKPNLVAENLWEIRGEWSNAFGRRMTVVRTAGGDVIVHNAIRLQPADLAWLRGLGTVRAIVAPNKFHTSDAAWAAAEFPGAELFVPGSKLGEFTSKGVAAQNVAEHFPKHFAGELECIPMLGTRVDESAFIHSPSRTLILCDLAMNMEDVFTGIQGAFMRWNKVGGRFGVSRLARYVFSKDKKAVVSSYHRLFERDFDRVIVNHGAVLESGGKDALRESVAEIFGRTGSEKRAPDPAEQGAA